MRILIGLMLVYAAVSYFPSNCNNLIGSFNKVQGSFNTNFGNCNSIQGNGNLKIGNHINSVGSGNKLTGANYNFQGNGVHMFGPTAHPKFYGGNLGGGCCCGF